MGEVNGIYRFAFNGKEHDPELKGARNIQDYGFRMYDDRLGRFFTVDPLREKYPMLSTYQFAGNTPIQAIDMDGLEPAKPPKTNGQLEDYHNYTTNGHSLWLGQIGPDGSSTWSDLGPSSPTITVVGCKTLAHKTEEILVSTAGRYVTPYINRFQTLDPDVVGFSVQAEVSGAFMKGAINFETYSTAENNMGVRGSLSLTRANVMTSGLGGLMPNANMKAGLYFEFTKDSPNPGFSIEKSNDISAETSLFVPESPIIPVMNITKNTNNGDKRVELGLKTLDSKWLNQKLGIPTDNADNAKVGAEVGSGYETINLILTSETTKVGSN